MPVEPGRFGRQDQAFVTTTDGLRIEILEDKSQRFPIQHEHVHFFLPEDALTQSQAWYAKHFGAKTATRNKSPVADIPGVQLRFAKVEKPQAQDHGDGARSHRFRREGPESLYRASSKRPASR